MTTADPLSVPTSLPCPPWCQLPAGHGFDAEYGGELHRSHEAATADFRFTGPEGAPINVSVRLLSIESAPEPDGPPSTSPPVVYLDEAEGLAGPQARQVAAALLDAADMWDEAQV